MKITLILTVIGSLAGFAYASVLGCESACSITASSSLDTTVIGAFAGLIIALPINKKINKK
jgi:outer membrane lipoprotein SlyB|tara:strand:+ start:7103 stop:7285 length:183 start_codon:yes stop_codon:yes gene_type:complete